MRREDDEPVEATDVDEAVAAADVDEIDEAHEIEEINGEAAQAETDGDAADAADAEVPAEIDLSDAVPDWVTEDRSGAGSSGASSESPDEEADDTEGTVIDLEARRTVEVSADPGVMGDDDEELDELDPELPSGDAIDERRQAERRQLFEEQADAGETVLEFTPVMEEFGPADDPVPLVPPRERGDIDELFARIRESRADAVAQAREVLHRTSEMPVVQIGSTTPTADSPTADASSQDRLAHRDAVLEEFAPEVALSLKRSLADQLNEVLDVLRRSPEGITDVEQLVPDGADRTFGESVRELLGQAAVRATGGSSIDIGPVVRAVGGEIGGSLRGRISSHLGDPDQLERRIRSIYREWRRDRVDDVASDAVAAAYGLGLLGSLPDGTAVRWVIPEDGCCGADCYDNSLATDVVAGEPFPTGDLMAPARPGCRGLVVPADQ